MTTELMYDLAIDIRDNGHIELKQVENGETERVLLHPDQLALIAKFAGLPIAGATETAAVAAENRRLRRRLAKLDELIGEFALDSFYRNEIIERCGYSSMILAELDALLAISTEFVADLTAEPPHENIAAHAGRAESATGTPTPCQGEKNTPQHSADGQMNLSGVE